jgi:hypothetical protein
MLVHSGDWLDMPWIAASDFWKLRVAWNPSFRAIFKLCKALMAKIKGIVVSFAIVICYTQLCLTIIIAHGL